METVHAGLEWVFRKPWRGGGGGGVTPIDWDAGCVIFLGYFFGLKINFLVYFKACDRFLGQDFSLE